MSNKKYNKQTEEKTATTNTIKDVIVSSMPAMTIPNVTNSVPTIHLAAPVKIKYKPGAHKLERTEKGDWIDLYTYEDATLAAGEFALIDLGFACELPSGFEANIVPRSSTFKHWGVIQTNHFAVIDSTYCGDNDYWLYPVYATRDVHIPAGTRICQFRINRVQPSFDFEEVETLGNEDRNGIGSTGR